MPVAGGGRKKPAFYLPFLGGAGGVGFALAKAAAFFCPFCKVSCFFCLSLDLGDLSPMADRL